MCPKFTYLTEMSWRLDSNRATPPRDTPYFIGPLRTPALISIRIDRQPKQECAPVDHILHTRIWK